MILGRLGSMKLLAFVALLCLSASACFAKEKEHVVTINGDADFEKVVKDSDFLVAEFYAPWCGHCKSLAPEYEKAAKTLKDNESTAVLAKVRSVIPSGIDHVIQVQSAKMTKPASSAVSGWLGCFQDFHCFFNALSHAG